MNNFSNPVIECSELPRFEEVALNPVSNLYWRVILINLLISLLITAGMVIGIVFIASPLKNYLPYIIGIFIAFWGGVYRLQQRAFQRRGYAVRQHDIIYRRGTLGTLTTVIPFQRIQHVNVNEGVFSRAYGLAQLQIFTAGGMGSDIKISGLLREDAIKIKELILNRMTQDEI